MEGELSKKYNSSIPVFSKTKNVELGIISQGLFTNTYYLILLLQHGWT